MKVSIGSNFKVFEITQRSSVKRKNWKDVINQRQGGYKFTTFYFIIQDRSDEFNYTIFFYFNYFLKVQIAKCINDFTGVLQELML